MIGRPQAAVTRNSMACADILAELQIAEELGVCPRCGYQVLQVLDEFEITWVCQACGWQGGVSR